LESYSFIIGPFPKCFEFEKTLTVAIKQGGIAKAAISAVLEKSDSKIKYNPFLATKVAPKGEIVKESKILSTTS
jgi:hypothetical protein